MANVFDANKKQIKALQTQLTKLQAELAIVNKAAGIDDYIDVSRRKVQSRFERIKRKNVDDTLLGYFLIILNITAKKEDVYIPLSVASGKKQTGFIYQIEGTGESGIVSANVTARGEGVSRVVLGTLEYIKIPALKTAEFNLQIQIRGKQGKIYKLLIHRINYKLAATDVRYQQYTKEIPSDTLRFS